MPKRDFSEVVQEIFQADPRYAIESYTFIREGLDYTLKHLRRNSNSGSSAGGSSASAPALRGHVSGQELLHGIRDYALREFGPMSKTVLNEWGIKKCEDFGDIVFNLVKYGVLGKTDSDSLSDFKQGFSFHDAFVKPFRPQAEENDSAATGEASSPRAKAPRKTKPAPTKKPESQKGL
ncbi:Verruc_Plancto-restricted protein [Verrucomicrobium sp. GAS474]|uniref:Minf_1886 family protein n=1 Tax=Verrucomicrobium sp. GAS474 TaxID=1882831 RepID=UPI00087D1719|nr:Minf_1886 family protein [Verrucomicrobium sp. GAS474]SDU06750.1 Verruc_Plancto-restricted protein [Verrucomicrobium sp. GAS474]